jgi:type IV pilus assembly protein PilM
MSTVVALDIGSSCLAAVELRATREKTTIAKAGFEPLPEGLVADGEVVQPDALAQHIKRFWKANKFTGRRVRLGVANQRVVVRTIEMPAIDDPDARRAAVAFEAAEHIPIPADQAVVDSHPVLRYQDENGDRERVVIVAAHREMVETLVQAVKKAGLQPVGVDLEAFALLRALLPPAGLLDEGAPDTPAQAVCHIGAQMTNVIVSLERRCQFTRLVSFGGDQLTQAVAERTGLPAAEAEALKTACGLLGEPLEGWDVETVGEVRHALALAARPLLLEIRRSLDYYRSQSFARPIDRLVISGGTALCAGLDRYLQQALGIPVVVGNPLQYLDAGAEIAPEVVARSAVAVGLALDSPEGVA